MSYERQVQRHADNRRFFEALWRLSVQRSHDPTLTELAKSYHRESAEMYRTWMEEPAHEA